MRKLSVLFAGALTVAVAAPALAQQGGTTYRADLSPLNGSGSTGTAMVTVMDNQVTVEIQSTSMTSGAPHAQHIHIGGQNMCPTNAADTNGDGIITTAEGQPFYGAVQVSLTTEGAVGADSALAVERFPMANDSGMISYSRTFSLPEGVTAADVANGVIVQHGIDLNDSGTYDGDMKSSLDPSLPLEATVPANCGALMMMSGGQSGAAPTMMPKTGGAPIGALAVFASTILGAGFGLRRFWR